MLDSIFSVHEISSFRDEIAAKTRTISALSVPVFLPPELCKDLPVLSADLDLSQQVRSVLQRLLQRHPPPPSPDYLMVPSGERLRNCNTHKVRGPRVVRIVEQTPR